jgi:hypothetical protein
MNMLSTLMSLVAQAAAPKAAPADPSTPLFGADGYLQWWQVILILVLIGGLVYYFIWKKKQDQ